jgi:hypothetical protein
LDRVNPIKEGRCRHPSTVTNSNGFAAKNMPNSSREEGFHVLVDDFRAWAHFMD